MQIQTSRKSVNIHEEDITDMLIDSAVPQVFNCLFLLMEKCRPTGCSVFGDKPYHKSK